MRAIPSTRITLKQIFPVVPAIVSSQTFKFFSFELEQGVQEGVKSAVRPRPYWVGSLGTWGAPVVKIGKSSHELGNGMVLVFLCFKEDNMSGAYTQ